MSIDLNETLITLAEAARSVPGKSVHIGTIHRWRLAGCRGIKLETILRGGVRHTSREALGRFFERVTARADGGELESRTPRQREAAINAAEKRLAARGI